MAETSNLRPARSFATGVETRLGEQKTLLIISSVKTRSGIEWSRIRWKEHGMNRVKLTIATTDYDHFRDFRLGLVNAEGINHTWLTLGHHEIFARFTFNREWDVSELSFAKFIAQVTRKESDIIGLPVVCSRLFRFSSFYVNKKSKINNAKDLKGKTVGSPEWAHTAAVYMRGWLTD
jgi:4,5-dihydroxyphthalate decarboxylase